MTPLEKPKVAIYLRVSTDRQDEANQEPDARRLALARYPLERFDHVYLREVESGVKDRPVWNAIVEAARVGEIDAVVVWSLDRIGRQMWRVLDDVRELDRFHVELVSVREPWCDTSGPARSLLLVIFAWVAQHEHDRLRDRTKAGMARAAAQGRHAGRPPIVVPENAVARALQLRELGLPLSHIRKALAAELGVQLNYDEQLRRVFRRHEKGRPDGGSNPAPDVGSGKAA